MACCRVGAIWMLACLIVVMATAGVRAQKVLVACCDPCTSTCVVVDGIGALGKDMGEFRR